MPRAGRLEPVVGPLLELLDGFLEMIDHREASAVADALLIGTAELVQRRVVSLPPQYEAVRPEPEEMTLLRTLQSLARARPAFMADVAEALASHLSGPVSAGDGVEPRSLLHQVEAWARALVGAPVEPVAQLTALTLQRDESLQDRAQEDHERLFTLMAVLASAAGSQEAYDRAERVLELLDLREEAVEEVLAGILGIAWHAGVDLGWLSLPAVDPKNPQHDAEAMSDPSEPIEGRTWMGIQAHTAIQGGYRSKWEDHDPVRRKIFADRWLHTIWRDCQPWAPNGDKLVKPVVKYEQKKPDILEIELEGAMPDPYSEYRAHVYEIKPAGSIRRAVKEAKWYACLLGTEGLTDENVPGIGLPVVLGQTLRPQPADWMKVWFLGAPGGIFLCRAPEPGAIGYVWVPSAVRIELAKRRQKQKRKDKELSSGERYMRDYMDANDHQPENENRLEIPVEVLIGIGAIGIGLLVLPMIPPALAITGAGAAAAALIFHQAVAATTATTLALPVVAGAVGMGSEF